MQRPNGLVTTYSYDPQNRLKAQTTTDALGLTVLERFTYTLDPTGQRIKLEELNGRVTTWAYDELYRLTEETVQDPQHGNRTTSWTYDKVGNRLTQAEEGATTTYAYDLNDRLQSESGARNITYEYDDNGNTLGKQSVEGETIYIYNDANRLVAVTTPTDSLGYSYDASGIRRSKTENGVTTHYLVDPNQSYAQVLGEYQNNVEQVWYTYGNDLLSQQRGDSLGYYHYDGLGSTRALSDDSGELTDAYAYTAFGELDARTGDSENAYLYTGEQFDSGLNQYYLRARYYDQGVGRFTQQDIWMGRNHDPITLHKYLYANIDPANLIDPTGNFGISSSMSGVGVAGIFAAGAVVSYQLGQNFAQRGFDSGVSSRDAGLIARSGRIVDTTQKLTSWAETKKGRGRKPPAFLMAVNFRFYRRWLLAGRQLLHLGYPWSVHPDNHRGYPPYNLPGMPWPFG